MTSQEKTDYIEYRLEKAQETFEVARLLVENKKWNSAVNRLYYAAYYAVTALLVQASVQTKTHSGVKAQFFLHYIKPGTISLEYAKLYADLFDWRQKGDYGDFFDFKEEEVLSVLNPTEKLIEAIIKRINQEQKMEGKSEEEE